MPASQIVHAVEAAVEYDPGAQLVQVLSDVAPAVELAFPAAQLEHDVAASELEYDPRAQLVHVLSEVAPGVELAFPAPHARQVSTVVAETVEL